MSIFDTDVSPAVAEARLLHPQQNGFFTVGGKAADGTWKEDHFHLSSLDAVSASLRGRSDTYISQATFATRLRRSFNTKSLRCAFVDIDQYSLGIPGADAQELADKVIERARAVGVAEPSYIASSGRGLYAKWIFDSPVNASLLPNWKLLQKKLMSAYLPLGADMKVVDPARVLRLQETINSKSDSSVHLLRQGSTHAFADLVRSTADLEVLRRKKDGSIVKTSDAIRHRGERLTSRELITDEALTDLDNLDLYAASRTPVMLQRVGAQALNWARFLDLRDLIQLRGGIHRGSRDIMLFWMVNFLARAGVITAANFWAEVRSLLQSFPVSRDFNPLQDGSLQTLLAKVQAQGRGERVQFGGLQFSPTYTPSNDSLLDMLQISTDEEQQLRTIISKDEKRRRADEKVPGRAERRTERQEAREIAVSMKEQGVSTSQIAKSLGKSPSTISRWLKPDERVGRPYIETRGRKRRQCNRPMVQLTGRGAVTIEPSTTAAGLADIKRKTKIRQERPHLCTQRRTWNPEQITSWLQERRRAPHPAHGLSALVTKTSIEVAAQKLVDNLMLELRRMRSPRAEPISISQTPSVSSGTINGPPF